VNPVYVVGGSVLGALTVIAYVREGASKQTTLIGLLSAGAFIAAGVEHSLADALLGSVAFAMWIIVAIPERLHRRGK